MRLPLPVGRIKICKYAADCVQFRHLFYLYQLVIRSFL